MDYYKLQNIKADTSMRNSLSSNEILNQDNDDQNSKISF